MSTTLKVGGFLLALAALFAVAAGVGNAVDPVEQPEPEAHGGGHEETPSGHLEHVPAGLMVSQSGYTLAAPAAARAGHDVPVTFRIEGPDGEPVTTYDVEHERRMHLIAVRRDFSGFQHVHPELDSAGTWHARLDLTAGAWRLFADFKPTGGEPLTLGSDLAVPGRAEDAHTHGDTRTADVDGYTVTLEGTLTPGEESPLTLHVERDGVQVQPEPYLGARGHLVALREGDLAYLHVHPESTEALEFAAAVPSVGRYHLFLDFQHEGVVRTAAFRLSTQGSGHDDEH